MKDRKPKTVDLRTRPADAPKDVPYYSEVVSLADAHDLVDLVLARQALKDQIAEMEAKCDTYTEAIQLVMNVAEVASVGVSHYKVTRAEGRQTKKLTGESLLRYKVDVTLIAKAAIKVDGQALLSAGVPATTIQKATEIEVGQPYITITDISKSRAKKTA